MKEKRELDQTDLELVRLLAEDARRPYSDLAEHVGLSAPAVSDRIDRLQEQGVIRQFTLDIDRLKLQNRTPVMVTFRAHPTDAEDLYGEVSELTGIEHAFKLYDGTIIAYGNAPDDNPNEWLHEGIDMERIDEVDIDMVEKYEWSQQLDEAEFSLPCAVCEKTIQTDGITTEIGGETLMFCCQSCKNAYEERYDRFQANSE